MQGQTINGYTLKHRLGEGGMAEVWYAENEIGKPAAVKILNENLSRKTQIVERFHNEALVMVKLDHPNIRQVYGYGYLGDRHCIIMEYLDGDDLDALLKNGRHFTDEELRRWWNQTVDALNYTHAMGIVHRDIKPSNIFLDKKGNIKLLDFGIAKVKESMSMTRTGMTMGTLMYMSPEQVKDPKRVDSKSDIYSLAVSFVHLLTGKPIYDSDTSSEFDIQLSIVSKPVDLSALPQAWQGFLTPYLEKDPDKRPALRHFEEVAYKPQTVEAKTVVGSMSSAVSQPSSADTRIATPSTDDRDSVTSPTAENRTKSKLWLWIVLAALGIGVVSYVVVNNKKKQDRIQQEMEARLMEENFYNSCSSVADYQDYMYRYPNGRFVSQASNKIQEMNAKMQEESFFNNCSSIADYQDYLNRYPNGQFAAQASSKIEQMKHASLESSINAFIQQYTNLTEASDNQLIDRLVSQLFAPTVKRYFSAYDKDRSFVADSYKRYDDTFQVYGKHSSVRWNTVSFTESNGNIQLTYVEDYSIDRYDNTKYSIFVLEKHFELNSDFKIVSLYDVQLSKSKK
jgi:serine/threonine protein kinase